MSEFDRLSRGLRRLIILGLLSSLPGCALVQLRDEARAFYGATVLVGRVTVTTPWQGDIVVAAVTQGSARAIAHQARLHEPGGYELIVPNGNYTLLAYGDRDRNGVPDADGPAGVLPLPVEVDGAALISLLDFSLTSGRVEALRARMPDVVPATPSISTQAGAPADMRSPAFSRESGVQGYWAPMEFFRAVGGNVFFLEPYDATKIPVLFIHGAAGSAQDWRHAFEHLDRTRYQAWFFQYPSGAALDSITHLLYWKLLNLKMRYGFERLHIVAHSMGGLVARRFLLDHAEQFPEIGQFVSISTPWAGEPAATLGVEHSPAVVPSWRDMQPDGRFLRSLFARALPSHVTHTLLFGHRGGYSLLRPTTDGTVTLASQLWPDAQAQAQLVLGFDEDHVSILESRDVLNQLDRILIADRGGAGGGRLQLVPSFADSQYVPGELQTLVLTPSDAGSMQPWILPLPLPLPSNEHGRTIGPIPAGRYEVAILTPAFRSVPHRRSVTIGDGQIVRLDFTLEPLGVLTGHVVAKTSGIDTPAGSLRRELQPLAIRRIELEGPSVRRSLQPRNGGAATIIDAYVEGRDDAVGGAFSFVDLPAGEYSLSITADGYEPYTSDHRVEPGVATPAVPIVLRACR